MKRLMPILAIAIATALLPPAAAQADFGIKGWSAGTFTENETPELRAGAHPYEFKLANVYLRSSDNKLPDLVVDLRGPASLPIRVELAGRTDSLRGALRNTFDLVPDALVSKFRLELLGGNRGLVVNSRNLCAKPQRATVKLRAHSGAAYEARPVVQNDCGKKRKKRQAGPGA